MSAQAPANRNWLTATRDGKDAAKWILRDDEHGLSTPQNLKLQVCSPRSTGQRQGCKR